MTSLIRARGSLQEISTLFGARPNGHVAWQPWIWPGEAALVVTQDAAGERQLQTMPWGLPETTSLTAPSHASRGILYSRDMMSGGRRIVAPHNLERCLIVIEACAYPGGETSRRTRIWAGIWDEPLCAWAGLCTSDRDGCAGMLMPANKLLSRVSSTMPMLLDTNDQKLWLAGESPLTLSLPYTEDNWYLETNDEAWASGQTIDWMEE